MTFTPQDADRVRAAAREVLERHHVPGMVVGVVLGDDLLFAEGFGLADIESGEQMTPERGQRIASITKTMVGLCAMALVDENKLRLEDRVVDLLPDVRFDGPAETMTVWHLLTHTSGIGEAPTLERLRQVANPDRSASEPPGDFATLYPGGVVVEVPPATKWAYCNNGYALLGEIIARAEKAPLEQVMERRIFEPLGMRDSLITDQPHARITTGYHRAPSADTRFQLERAGIPVRDETTVDGHNIRGKFTSDFNRGMRAAGGVQSTVPDMARYASMLLRGGEGVVQGNTLRRMIAPGWCPDDRLQSWGLAFHRAPRFGRTMIGHGGAYFGGWNSSLEVISEENIAIIQHMNVMMDRPLPVFARIQRAVLDAPREEAPQRPVDRTLLKAAPGEYALTMPGPLTNFRPATRLGPLRVTRDVDSLMLTSRWGTWKKGARLRPWGEDDPAFLVVDEPDEEVPARIALMRKADGSVAGLRCDELVYMERRGE